MATFSTIVPTQIPATIEARFKARATGSITMANNAGDSRQPCHVPLPTRKGSESSQPNFIWAVGKERSLTHFKSSGPKPINSRTVNIYGQATESKAFSISSVAKTLEVETTKGNCEYSTYIDISRLPWHETSLTYAK